MEQSQVRAQETSGKRRWLTPKQVSERYDFSVPTLARYRCEGTGAPYVKVSAGKVFYAEDAFESWLESKTRTSTSHGGLSDG